MGLSVFFLIFIFCEIELVSRIFEFEVIYLYYGGDSFFFLGVEDELGDIR